MVRSLASLYWDQGDYLEFLKYAQLGLRYKAPESCQPPPPSTSSEGAREGACAVPPYELDIIGERRGASTCGMIH